VEILLYVVLYKSTHTQYIAGGPGRGLFLDFSSKLKKSMNLYLSYLALGVGLLITALLLRFAFRLWRVDSIEGKKSAARASSIRNAVRGRARMHEDWIPDARVKGGMIYNKKAKRLEISGRLSDESFDRVFRRT
jgi:hypothetical protein